MMKVLAFGEILWDIIEGSEHLGGAPFNFAAHMAQCGNDVKIISRVGNDSLGTRALDLSTVHGVDDSWIQTDQVFPTGIVDVTLSDGQPDYVIRENAAFDYILSDNIEADLVENVFDVFYFGSLVQRNAVSARTLAKILSTGKFKHIFYDVNLRKLCYSVQIVKDSLSACTILKLNRDEISMICEIFNAGRLSEEEFCRYIKALYPAIKIIIITAAEDGCFIYESEFRHVAGVPVKVRDAVGAGDAFSAAFMHIYAASGDAVTAAKIANNVGAFVATETGGIPKYSDEVKTLLKLDSSNLNTEVGLV
jgi:fructokinase